MRTIRPYQCCLTAIALAVALASISGAAITANDCLVIVHSTTPTEGRPGTGFTIGDGTLVVTAYHVVAEASEQGEHRMLGVIKILSPYLGRCCYANVVAADPLQDLVVLKIPWRGHPAFELVDDRQLLEATDLEIIGMLPVLSAVPPESRRPFPPSFTVERDTIEVDFVALRHEIPLFISLAGRGQVGPGWSGAPIVLPDTLEAAGCFVELNKSVSNNQLTCRGPALAQAKRLIEANNAAGSLIALKTHLPEASDGYRVARLFLQAHKALVREDYKDAWTKTRELLALRPKTSAFYVLAAQLYEKQLDFGKAKTSYEKALSLDPNTPVLRMLYGQFLLERDPARARAILESLWEHRRLRPWLVLIMGNQAQRRPAGDKHYMELLREALAVEPHNAYLWLNLGAAELQEGLSDEGFASMTKAVELFPERSSLRGQLARLLEQDGRLDEAEAQFSHLLKIEPENPVVYFWYARFLARHRPEARPVALEAAQRALALPPRHGLPRKEIEQLIEELRRAEPGASEQEDRAPANR